MANREIVATDSKYMRSVIIPFIKENSERRVSNDLIAYYQNYALHKPLGDDVLIVEASDVNSIQAISLATIKNHTHVFYSTTVTAKGCRRKGKGLEVLKTKLEVLKSRGVGIKSTVAEDNEAGINLCAKVGLRKVETVEKLRKSGPYNAVIWTDPPVARE